MQALLHQHVVIGNVPGGGLEGFDSGFSAKAIQISGPVPFKIQTGNFHKTLPFVVIIESSEPEL
jgi:hypothetical protein